MNFYSQLAYNTIKQYLTDGTLPDTHDLPSEMLNTRAGCFVSLHNKKDNSLRGCIGTIYPSHKNITGEIIANAIEASTHDPRFSPVNKDEIDNLKISVDILSEPEPINSETLLNPKKFGVIVSSDGRTGLLLPDIEGVDTIKDQISIAKEKAGIIDNHEIQLYRFTVKRYE